MMEKQVLDYLDKLGIKYEHHTHDEMHTIEDCLALPFLNEDILYFKNIFACNAQKTIFYLIILEGNKKFVTKDVSKQLEVSRLSFASDEHLHEMLKLKPGSVSPFGLINDKYRDVTLVLDSDIKSGKKLAFHPNHNKATIILTLEDFQTYLKSLRVTPKYIKI